MYLDVSRAIFYASRVSVLALRYGIGVVANIIMNSEGFLECGERYAPLSKRKRGGGSISPHHLCAHGCILRAIVVISWLESLKD